MSARDDFPSNHDFDYDAAMDEIDRLRAVVVPLHDAWLKANPSCPTCGGKGEEPPRIHYGRATTYTTGCICRDCSDGVLPFDKWTAGLVALWEMVHGPDCDGEHWATSEARTAIHCLRQIGGAR